MPHTRKSFVSPSSYGRLLFLDIDGVLNTGEFLAGMSTRSGTHWENMMDPEKVILLNQLHEVGFQVVISSSWRIGHDISFFQDILSKKGFLGEVVGLTDEFDESPRSDEILDWMDFENYRVDTGMVPFNYFVLDDDDDAGETLPPFRFIKTNREEGLTQRHIDLILRQVVKAEKFGLHT